MERSFTLYDYGEWGDEPAALIASKTGRYRFEIHTEAGSPPAGRYRLRVEALRAPTATDIARAEVVRAQNDAFPLIRSNKADYGKGRTQDECILAMWESLGDGVVLLRSHRTAIRIGPAGRPAGSAGLRGAGSRAAYRRIANDYGEAAASGSGDSTLAALGNGERRTTRSSGAWLGIERRGRISPMILLLADWQTTASAPVTSRTRCVMPTDAISLAHDSRNPLLESRGWNAAGLDASESRRAGSRHRRLQARAHVGARRGRYGRAQVESCRGWESTFLSLGDSNWRSRLLEEGLAGWIRFGFRANSRRPHRAR